MTNVKRFPFLAALGVALLAILSPLGSRTVRAAGPLVRDSAHLFDPATVEQVDGIVKEIHARFGKDLTIETFANIPESLRPSFAAKSKEEFYELWVRHEAQAAQTNGIFILIVKEPSHLQIGVGQRTHQKAFTFADRDELIQLMLKQFRDKKFDEGLTEGANFVLQRLEKNEGGNTPSTPTVHAPPAPAETQPATTPVVPLASPATVPAASPATVPATEPGTEPASKPAFPVPATKPGS
jgi:uncharacterized membrane protein YgcG